METLFLVLVVSVVVVLVAAALGGAVGKLLFDFVTAPLREDDEE